MAILSRDALFERLQTLIGDKTDDDTLTFLEDVKDTVDDYEKKGGTDTENWKEKFAENEKMWREKYRDTFFGKSVPDTTIKDNAEDIKIENEKTKEDSITYDDLFNEKEG